MWYIQGICTSLFSYYITLHSLQECQILNKAGETIDFWITSNSLGMVVVLTGNLCLWLYSRYLTNWSFAAFFGFSFGFYYVYLWGAHYTHWVGPNHSVVAMHTSGLVWAVVAVVVLGTHAVNLLIMRT